MPRILSLCYNKDMKKKVYPLGFTLVELSLSLIFVSILSMTVVLLIQNTTASYRRGLVLNQINTVGMDLIDDFRTSIQNAASDSIIKMCELYYEDDATRDNDDFDNCKNDRGKSFVSVTKKGKVYVGGTPLNGGEDMPVYGAFCTGTYTFIWNSGYFEQPEYVESRNERKVIGTTDELEPVYLSSRNKDTDPLVREYPSSSSDNNLRLLKIYDTERTICVNAMKEQNSGTINPYVMADDYDQAKISDSFVISKAMLDFDVDKSAGEGVVELLNKNGESDLVLYDLYVAPPAFSETRNNFFFSAAFILGTRRGGINITEAGDTCKPPSDDFSELDYCAINKFNFAVQAGGA